MPRAYELSRCGGLPVGSCTEGPESARRDRSTPARRPAGGGRICVETVIEASR